jgi:hypothetical protein
MRDEVFEARGRDGLIRRGILSEPAAGRPKAALMLVTAGVKYRTGPSQLYIALARALAARGFATLRYDVAGVGESDGVLEAGPSHVIYQEAERGRFVPDVELGFASLGERLDRHTPLYLGGLCGGGLTAQLAASRIRDARLSGVLSFNIAVRHSPVPGRQQAVGASEARASLASYPTKLASMSTWTRLLSGGVGVRHVRRTLSAALGRTHASNDEGLNPLFIPSFRKLIDRKVRQLLIFSGNDGRWLPFNDLILGPVLGGVREGPTHSVRLIAEADHHLCWPEWRSEAVGRIADWMDEAPTGRAGA